MPGDPPPVPAPYDLEAHFEILAVIAGTSAPRHQEIAQFGPPYGGRFVVPLSPERETSEYFVVSFLDAKGSRTLLGFPLADEAYDEWRKRIDESLPKRPPLR